MTDTPTPSTTTRLSFTHERAELRADNPLYARAPSARTAFEAERMEPEASREERRVSFLAKRQRPAPVQRPRPGLALGPDGTAFNADWEAERQRTRQRDR
ncbi:hypothetical protein [Novosphingobium beihaiensis]|uniref:Uncharacterized protein n=1 Tax=Novosphingobium beihaiensis TaxID=2930389 RepID=A0ABT0BS63_9SPHN|nr:hypothetical protein [Novosphingobium beihaiensis]MCJ2187900.1 hypothetical protein [Novosphingobium beihaiensis]